MKRTIVLVVFILVCAVLILVGCKTVNAPPEFQPKVAGCSLTVSALGYTLCAGISWTNTNGHSGSGMTVHPDSGSVVTVLADPSVSCATNQPFIAAVSFVCHGTNMPMAIPLALPVNCNAFTTTVNYNCDTCSFSASSPQGQTCNPIYRPRKK